jgi:hypothetical protein
MRLIMKADDDFGRLLTAASNFAHDLPHLANSTQSERRSKKNDVEQQLKNLHRMIDRILAVGIPPCPDGYKDGETGWLFDVNKALSDLRELSGKLLGSSLAVPVPPVLVPGRGASADEQQRLNERIQSFAEFTRENFKLGQFLRTEFWQLVQDVRRSRHSGMRSNLDRPNHTEPQPQISAPVADASKATTGPPAAGPSPSSPLSTLQADASDEAPASLLAELLSAAQLATRLDQPPNRVELFLRRYRTKYPDCCIDLREQDAGARRKNQPAILYRYGDVWPALQEQMKKWSK